MQKYLLPFSNLFDLFFPISCIGCEKSISRTNSFLCPSCLDELSVIDNGYISENTFNEQMQSLKIKHADGFSYFWKGNISQKLIYQMKYHGQKGISNYFGQLYCESRAENTFLKNTNWDVITTVPLHPKKQLKRGYNQADGFAECLSKKYKLTFFPDLLKRVKHLKSQTTKNRQQRLERLMGSFVFSPAHENKGYNKILVVDDVFTTGGTTRACTEAIRRAYPKAEIGWIFIGISI